MNLKILFSPDFNSDVSDKQKMKCQTMWKYDDQNSGTKFWYLCLFHFFEEMYVHVQKIYE